MTYDDFVAALPALQENLRRVALRMGPVGNLMPEDLVQETVAILLKNTDRLPEGDRLRIYSLTVMRNERYRALRRLGRRPIEAPLEDPETGEVPDQPVAAGQEDSYMVQRVLAVIDTLPDDTRDLVWEAVVLRAPQEDMAARLGVPLGTVKSRINRACRDIRMQLEATPRSRCSGM